MARKRKGKSAKKAKAGAVEVDVEEDLKKFPHSLVIPRGNVGKNISQLLRDMRRVMEPFTASHLKVKKRNVLKDFVNVAGPLNVSHFMTFTKTELGSYMRVMRVPRGPTLTFKINEYCLSRDLVSSMKRHSMDQRQFQHHPLLVMNGFSGNGMHIKLMTTMFQNLFPSINVNKIKLTNIRRCVLLNYLPDEEILEMRHYSIKTVPVGMSRSVKKIIKAEIPNMGRLQDVSDYMLRAGDMSESEAELDGPHNEVIMPQATASRGSMKAAKSAIRLTEIGPRLKLQLVKIEEGLCEGEVLFHKYIEKTDEDKKLLASKRRKKKKLKDQRKQTQRENIEKKEAAKETNKERSLAGMKKKAAALATTAEGGKQPEEGADFEEVEDPGTAALTSTDPRLYEDSEDDEDYYRKEVGEEPEPELFPKKTKGGPGKRKSFGGSGGGGRPHKKFKKNTGDKTSTGDGQDKKAAKKRGPMTEMDRIKKRKTIKNKKVQKMERRKRAPNARPRKR